MAVSIAEVERGLAFVEHESQLVTLVEFDSPDLATVPERWRDIATAATTQARCREALRLWNAEFLELVPEFAAILREELADVRIGTVDGEWVLIYALEHFDEEQRYVLCWIGWDPATFGASDPPLWDSVPEPLQAFLREVHAGFTAPDWMSFGPVQPRRMGTFAELNDSPDGIPEWMDFPDSTRLLPLVSTYSRVHGCVSPDLPQGEGVVLYNFDLDPPEPVGHMLDHILCVRFTVAYQETEG
ncbi:hypothetical protein ABZ319_04505 [Nocardia sp. NPDC005978]|uniref:hypothetical protein n=1 Tax=Nocardia sp. NPDC005978 TaxID=3156725 RepID=UPI00339EC523